MNYNNNTFGLLPSKLNPYQQNSHLQCRENTEAASEVAFRLGVCNMTIFDRGWQKCLHDLLLKKYRSIQHTFYQLQFWRLRLYIAYNTTYRGRVALTGRCTYSRSQKYIICLQALPVKRFIRALVWRPLFLSAYTRSTCTKTLSNSAWLQN